MALRYRIAAIFMAIMLCLCAVCHAESTVYTLKDPVLYMDGAPVFIAEGLSASLGLTEDGAWLEVFGGDARALDISAFLDDYGLWGSMGGFSAAYGISWKALGLLMGRADDADLLPLFAGQELRSELAAFAADLADLVDTGETETVQAPFSTGFADVECKRLWGTVTWNDLGKRMAMRPLLCLIYSALQLAELDGQLSELAFSVSGTAGADAQGRTVCQVQIGHGGNTWDVSFMGDDSSLSLSVSGTDSRLYISADRWLTGSLFINASLNTEDSTRTASFIRSSTGYWSFTADAAGAFRGSVTAFGGDGDIYAAVSLEEDGAERCVYVFTDDAAGDGCMTLGFYNPDGRAEICCDLTVVRDPEGTRAFSPTTRKEALVLPDEELSDLKNSVLRALDGALYVLRMNVPGTAYDLLDIPSLGDLIPSVDR